MALHVTAGLSYGAPPPSYPAIDGDRLEPPQAVDLLWAGHSIHVSTQESAVAILEAVGLTPAQVEFRLRVADGSWAHEVLNGGKP